MRQRKPRKSTVLTQQQAQQKLRPQTRPQAQRQVGTQSRPSSRARRPDRRPRGQKHEERRQKGPDHYAFIDSQNLNLAIRDQGWKLDFGSFRKYLRDKFQVNKAFIFIGHLTGNESLYTSLQQNGYIVIFKPTLESKEGVVKGNCDAELVLHAMIEYKNFGKAMVVSGDGDFHCLIEYLEEKGKLLGVGIPNRKKYSALLRRFGKFFFYVSDQRAKLEYKERRH